MFPEAFNVNHICQKKQLKSPITAGFVTFTMRHEAITIGLYSDEDPLKAYHRRLRECVFTKPFNVG
jgi:hypothetical protein